MFVVVAYIHPKVKVKAKPAANNPQIFKVRRLQFLSLDSHHFISGGLDISCTTRRSKTLDLCYSPIKVDPRLDLQIIM